MCAAAGGERNFAPGGQILALSGPRDPDFSGSLKAPRRILATLRTLSLKFKGRRTCSSHRVKFVQARWRSSLAGWL